jgi:hypothetical protein
MMEEQLENCVKQFWVSDSISFLAHYRVCLGWLSANLASLSLTEFLSMSTFGTVDPMLGLTA